MKYLLAILFPFACCGANYFVRPVAQGSANGTSLKGTGLNLGSNYSTDILGKTRTVPWDIGAYRFGIDANLTTVNVTTLVVGP